MTAIWKSAKVWNIHVPFLWHAAGALISLSLSLSGLLIHFVSGFFFFLVTRHHPWGCCTWCLSSVPFMIDVVFFTLPLPAPLKEGQIWTTCSYQTPFIKSLAEENYWLLTDRCSRLIDAASASHSEEFNEHPFPSVSPIQYSMLVCNFRELKKSRVKCQELLS